jgi:hypothetical protein
MAGDGIGSAALGRTLSATGDRDDDRAAAPGRHRE